jgi:hypothetical protein
MDATVFFLTVEKDGLWVRNHTGHRWKLKTVEQYNEFFARKARQYNLDIEDFTILCSSSLDFPEDYTRNKDTIALCNLIRG